MSITETKQHSEPMQQTAQSIMQFLETRSQLPRSGAYTSLLRCNGEESRLSLSFWFLYPLFCRVWMVRRRCNPQHQQHEQRRVKCWCPDSVAAALACSWLTKSRYRHRLQQVRRQPPPTSCFFLVGMHDVFRGWRGANTGRAVLFHAPELSNSRRMPDV